MNQKYLLIQAEVTWDLTFIISIAEETFHAYFAFFLGHTESKILPSIKLQQLFLWISLLNFFINLIVQYHECLFFREEYEEELIHCKKKKLHSKHTVLSGNSETVLYFFDKLIIHKLYSTYIIVRPIFSEKNIGLDIWDKRDIFPRLTQKM